MNLKRIRPIELLGATVLCGNCLYHKTEGCRLGSVEYNYAPCHRGVLFSAHPDKKIITLIRTFSLDDIKYKTFKKTSLTTKKFKKEIAEDFVLKPDEVEELIILVNRRLARPRVMEERVEKKEVEISPEMTAKAIELLRNPEVMELFIEDSGRNIVMDVLTRKMQLLACVSAYGDMPLNLAILGIFSSGKTKTITTSASYFRGVTYLFGMTPKALIHDKGTEDDKGRYIVDLRNQILVFLDEPHPQTMAMLKPLLSRDRFESTYKYVEKEGGLKTREVLLRGFPVAIFCAVMSKYLKEFTSRWLTQSPGVSAEKIGGVLDRQGEGLAHPDRYAAGEQFETFRAAFDLIRRSAPHRVVVPYGPTLARCFRRKKVVDMRFFPLFSSLIRASAILFNWQRERDDKDRIIADLSDYELAREVFTRFERPTVYGVGENVLDFYDGIVKTDTYGFSLSYEAILEKYKALRGEAIGRDQLRSEYLVPLERVGLIEFRDDPSDGRKKLISPISKRYVGLIDDVRFKALLANNSRIGEGV